jgi:hypothetical protein
MHANIIISHKFLPTIHHRSRNSTFKTKGLDGLYCILHFWKREKIIIPKKTKRNHFSLFFFHHVSVSSGYYSFSSLTLSNYLGSGFPNPLPSWFTLSGFI